MKFFYFNNFSSRFLYLFLASCLSFATVFIRCFQILDYFYLLSKDIFPSLILAFIIANIIFLYLNFKNKIFLGDNGVFINSFIISYFIIKSYNYNLEASLKSDEILLLILIPTLDLIRLFISRIRNLKNPVGIVGLIYRILQISSYDAAKKIISFAYSKRKTLHVTYFALVVYYLIKSIMFFIPNIYMKNER